MFIIQKTNKILSYLTKQKLYQRTFETFDKHTTSHLPSFLHTLLSTIYAFVYPLSFSLKYLPYRIKLFILYDVVMHAKG